MTDDAVTQDEAMAKLIKLAAGNAYNAFDFADSIRARREWLKLSKKDAAKRSGSLKVRDVNRLELADTLDKLKLYALVLGVELELKVHPVLSPEELAVVNKMSDEGDWL